MTSNCWAIVLAGGEGTRIQPFIRKCLGFAIPKQYFTFCGKRSMLEHTVARALELTCAERILTVTGNGHGRYIATQNIHGEVLEQPMARGTGAGVLLPAAHILARDPEATVLIFPSDHFVFPNKEFLEQVDYARRLVLNPSLPFILIGAVPDLSEPDYGWVEAGQALPEIEGLEHIVVRRVENFREKPCLAEAMRCFERGDLWNTMILAARLKDLWNCGQRLFPEIFFRFEGLRSLLRSRHPQKAKSVQKAVVELYRSIPSFDFSSSFLTPAARDLAVMPLKGIQWSDWGRPERVFESLRKIGKPPSFRETARRWSLVHSTARS